MRPVTRSAGYARQLLAFGLLAVTCLSGCWLEAEPSAAEAAPTGAAPGTPPRPDHIWPPQLGELYPDLELLNASGERVSIASLKGRVILVEPIGMDCPACNAFAGGNRPGVGGFQGASSQQGLPSVDEALRRYAGVDPDDSRLVHAQLLLYDMGRRGAPTPELGRRWAEHFGVRGPNRLVLIGEPYLIGPASYAMIPGFQLVDREGRLRFDSTGHRPQHDLWRELLPALAGLLDEVPAGGA